jgi:hypothetical protein
MEGEIGVLGKIAANAVIWDEHDDTRDDVMRAVATYADTVRKTMHEKWQGIWTKGIPHEGAFDIVHEGKQNRSREDRFRGEVAVDEKRFYRLITRRLLQLESE